MSTVPLDDDPLARRLRRRALTIPGVVLATILLWLLLPLWLLIAAGRDLLRDRRRWPTLRALALLAWYLACELWGLAGALVGWLITGFGHDRAALQRLDAGLQRAWSDALFRGMQHIFSVRLVLEADADTETDRPFILMLRHASLPDVLLPAVGWANPRRILLRYVLKVEVCWSPCLDVAGHRLPNAFVRRGSGDPAREIARVLALHHGDEAGGPLRPGQGLVIYPEGTRFSPAKKARLIARHQAAGDAAAADRVRAFSQVLPPRPGGPLALLAARAPGEDVVFCAHVGTETAASARALLDGGLVGAVFRVRVWRVPAEAVPRDPDAVRDWLDQWWHRVDDWVVAHSGQGPG